MATDPMAQFKKAAAETAVDRYVQSGMKLGIGTGSTMKFAIDRLGEKLKRGELKDVVGVSTSEKSTAHATELGIPLTELKEVSQLDLAIDGADEVDPHFALIKGLGGALLREKQVASRAKKFVVIVDESKLVKKLGTKSPLPVEVDRHGWEPVLKRLEELGGIPSLRNDATGQPYVTDNGNFIVDVRWPNGIDAPKELARTLESLKGVKDHGLFLDMANEVIVATGSGTNTLTRS